MGEVKIPREGRTQLRVGRLTKAHGLKGAVKLELYTDAPERRFVPGAVFSLQVPTSSSWHGKTLELVELKWFNAQPVAFFKDVPDRSAAEKLVKAILWIDHDPNEAPEKDAWFNHQLIGLKVIRDGKQVGTLAQVDHFPAQDLLTVSTENGDVLVPFVKSIVASVDIEAGEMVVTPPPGLFEEIVDDVPEAPEVEAPQAVSDETDAPEAP